MKKIIERLVLLTVLVCFAAISFVGQEKSLKNKPITIHRENESLGTIFRDLIEIYDVPIGFEESTLDAGHSDYLFEVNLPITGEEGYKTYSCTLVATQNVCPQRGFVAKGIKFTINVDNEPLENVLTLIVAQMKNYKWEINDDVVNITPIVGRDKILEEFLNLKIKNFSVKQYTQGNGTGKRTIADIRYSIMNTPELKKFQKENNFLVSSARYESPNLSWSIRKDMNFSNITLKELLNKITKIKRGGWALRMSDFFEKIEYQAIDIDI